MNTLSLQNKYITFMKPKFSLSIDLSPVQTTIATIHIHISIYINNYYTIIIIIIQSYNHII